jgi:hypothetical protein
MLLCQPALRFLAKISGKGWFLADGMPFELPPASNNIYKLANSIYYDTRKSKQQRPQEPF